MAHDSTRKPTQLVLLDRDGVINHDSVDYIKSIEEWQPISGSLAAIARLNKAGINTALCTNQSGISRGKLTARDLAAIHCRFSQALAREGGHISLWRFCPHHPDDNCRCRKPKTAMVDDCLVELSVDATETTFIGDSLKDMQAALAARCHPIFIDNSGNNDILNASDPSATGARSKLAGQAAALGVTEIVKDLATAAEKILQHNNASRTLGK